MTRVFSKNTMSLSKNETVLPSDTRGRETCPSQCRQQLQKANKEIKRLLVPIQVHSNPPIQGLEPEIKLLKQQLPVRLL